MKDLFETILGFSIGFGIGRSIVDKNLFFGIIGLIELIAFVGYIIAVE